MPHTEHQTLAHHRARLCATTEAGGRCPLWVTCGRRRLGKNFLTFLQHWSGAVMCAACLCGDVAAGHNALRGSGPNRKHAFRDAMTQAGSPDPGIGVLKFWRNWRGHEDVMQTKSHHEVCPLWVMTRHPAGKRQCLLLPRKRTFAIVIGTSALCKN
jgi:hypothetical protein